ncbi:hypothetical protein O6H91_01G044300 [Diphasiastrum complanatum]|uniref:Uncharacterized protein n=1 Tax=Diphasiastrum complanatum TaxID=34168 RepID=A0ACC2EQJ6_DIPCM|nr:hypothetical protein O6H91_01G044300 [Diphasiastrum complanatum]
MKFYKTLSYSKLELKGDVIYEKEPIAVQQKIVELELEGRSYIPQIQRPYHIGHIFKLYKFTIAIFCSNTSIAQHNCLQQFSFSTTRVGSMLRPLATWQKLAKGKNKKQEK